MRLLEKINRFPPRIVRLIAADLTTRQIALRSGIPRSTVHQVFLKDDWNQVTNEVTDRITMACGVNLLTHKRHRQNLKNRLRSIGKLAKRIKPTQRKMLNRLMSVKAA